MASIMINGRPEEPVPPAADPWLDSNDPISVQADEMFARQLDTGFAGEIRNLLHHPEQGLAGKDPEDALGGIAEAMPMLGDLKDRYLAQAIGPRQKAILEPLIDTRLDRASGDLGRIAQQATSVLDDRSVAERLADLQQDAALAWRDPAHLRALGRTAVGELRYQGERRGWDEALTDTTVRQGLSDLYAGAIEQAIANDPAGADELYAHAREVIQPERQTDVERKMERAREERRVAGVLSSLSSVSDDPTRRPDLDDYRARAAELTPLDASPEVRAQVNRMVRIEHAQADRAWQEARGRAATAALDWLGKNSAAQLLAMPADLRHGLSPEQTEGLDAAAINGGRVRTDADLYGNLAHQAVADPESFASIQLDQHRLTLSDVDYTRLTRWQRTIESGQQDGTLVQLGRASRKADSTLRQRGYDLEGPEAKEVRADIHHDVLEFEALEGRPANRADLDDIVAQAVAPLVTHQDVSMAAESQLGNLEADGPPAEESGEILPPSEGQAEVVPSPEPTFPPDGTSMESIDSRHQDDAANGDTPRGNADIADRDGQSEVCSSEADSDVGKDSTAIRPDLNRPMPAESPEGSRDEYDGLLDDLSGHRSGPATGSSEGIEKNSDIHLAQADNTVTPRGFTVERAPIELDPRKLNKPIPGAEQQQIANVLGKLAKGDFSGLDPHGYDNIPHRSTGARLPNSPNGYVVFDVPAPGLGRGVLRLIVERKTTAIYYTNNHYQSFYPVRLNPR